MASAAGNIRARLARLRDGYGQEKEGSVRSVGELQVAGDLPKVGNRATIVEVRQDGLRGVIPVLQVSRRAGYELVQVEIAPIGAMQAFCENHIGGIVDGG